MDSSVILITGASSGIGLCMATYLHSQGYQVIGTSRKATHGEQRNGITYVQLDVCDTASVQSAIDYILKEVGRIDVLINNAGIGMVGSVEDSSVKELQQHFDTNFYGPLRVMQAVLPSMRECKSGRIINISSLAGLFGLPYRGGYSAAKYALNGLTETMRMEVLQFGIHTSVICPGDFKTGIKNSRIEAEATQSSVYKDEFNRVHAILNAELDHAGDPILVAKTALKAIRTSKPRPYYIAASPFQRFVIHLRYWLPTRWFQWLMLRNYGMLPKE